jgi:peptide/nickel transport system substrate-binding protein
MREDPFDADPDKIRVLAVIPNPLLDLRLIRAFDVAGVDVGVIPAMPEPTKTLAKAPRIARRVSKARPDDFRILVGKRALRNLPDPVGDRTPLPEGLWGMPPEMLKTLPGYDPNVQKNRTQARQIMEKLGYRPENRLKVKVSMRDLPFFRDPTVLMIDQLKEVYIDGELETIDTANWLPKVMRRDYIVGFSPVGGGPDPDQNLYLNYGCGGELNYNGYCSQEVDRLIDRQSSEADPGKRKQLVWEIERKLAEDGARPIMFYDRRATCWQPRVKGLTIMVNSIANSARMEDIWLDN